MALYSIAQSKFHLSLAIFSKYVQFFRPSENGITRHNLFANILDGNNI
jgi:hypothetical protein